MWHGEAGQNSRPYQPARPPNVRGGPGANGNCSPVSRAKSPVAPTSQADPSWHGKRNNMNAFHVIVRV